MRKATGGSLLRGLGIAGLTALIVLLVLVRPLPEAPPPTAVVTSRPAASRTRAADEPSEDVRRPTSDLSRAATPTAAALPTVTRSLIPSPTAEPTPIPSPTPSPTFTPTATPVPNPTSAPSATPTAVKTGAAQEATPVPLAGRVEQHTYFSQVTGEEEPFRIYLPPGYDETDRRYPALYLLHGWPYDEAHWDKLGVDEEADAAIVGGALPPFIIVMPGADPDGLFVNTSGGAGSFEEQVVNELMPHVDATYRALPTRGGRAIGGISRGGVWALEIAFRHTDAFAAVGAHSPALSANQAPWPYDPFNLLREPGVEALRIYLSAGDRDWARESTQALHEALDEQGIANEFVVHEGWHADPLWAGNVGEYLVFYAAEW